MLVSCGGKSAEEKAWDDFVDELDEIEAEWEDAMDDIESEWEDAMDELDYDYGDYDYGDYDYYDYDYDYQDAYDDAMSSYAS